MLCMDRKKTVATESFVAESDYFELVPMEEVDLSFLDRRRALRPRAVRRAPIGLNIDKCNVLVQVRSYIRILVMLKFVFFSFLSLAILMYCCVIG